MDFKEYADEYYNVSIEEIQRIRAENYSDVWFNSKIRSLHERREWEKIFGKPGLRTQPLVHVLSVAFKPKNGIREKPHAIYGYIYVEYFDSKSRVVYELYKRERGEAEILGSDGLLTLNGPDYSFWPYYGCMPLFGNKINVNLSDETGCIFARSFFLDETNIEDDYEQVKSMSIDCEQGSIIVQYISIPFGVHCRIEIKVCSRQGIEQHDDLNVNGKIVARYANTYGNYSSEDCVLFEKQDSDFPVEINYAKRFPLSRCWVSLPAYSSLIVDLNLYEFKTMRKIVDQSVESSVEDGRITTSSILLDGIAIKIHVAWFSPELVGQRIDTKNGFRALGFLREETGEMNIEGGNSTEEIEEMDAKEEEESSDDESDDALPSSPELSWILRPHLSKPWESPALEIFSVIFGRERQKAVQIYGSIEVLSDDDDRICYIFKRDEKDALVLSENEKSLPVPDGSRVFDDCSSLQIKFNIKDTEGCLAIRGLVDWASSVLDTSLWHEKQLCSLIPGQHGGFAAIHYSIFSEAVGANIKVFLNPKTGCGDVCPMIWGSIVAQYSCYNYRSRYNKDYYRIVLFKKIQDDLIRVSDDSRIPLSRSMIVVPSYASLDVNVDILFGKSDEKFSCAAKIEIGEGFKIVETTNYFLRIELNWCEIK